MERKKSQRETKNRECAREIESARVQKRQNERERAHGRATERELYLVFTEANELAGNGI